MCLELVGSQGSTGAIRLEGGAAAEGRCFGAGAADVFQLEAAAVGEPRQLNVWVDMEGAGAGRAGLVGQFGGRASELVCGLGGPQSQSEGVPMACAHATPHHPPAPPAGDVSPGEAAWHLDSVEVAAAGSPRPTYFACRRWLDERCGYRAELPASAHNPRGHEAEYRVGGLSGCG